LDKHLHIVCFDVPYPPDYGGVIDVFYRIKALHEMGTKIHLHCFEYGRGKQPELNKYCAEVIYYKRYRGWKGFSLRLPYIVNSRANKNLLQNLTKDDHPVFLEGIHSTYFLFTNQLKNKKVLVRLHNVEFEYYRQLAKNETSFFKGFYFRNDSRLLKSYEKKIAAKALFLSVTKKDLDTYKFFFGAADIKYLPVFLPCTSVNSKEGKGSYCLYQGNLSVAENEKVAIWLCKKIFTELNTPFIIAGKNPSKNLEYVVQQNKSISLISNPSGEKMNELITNAQINVLPSFNSTGIKLKLLHALFTGRHCIVNKATVDGTGLEHLCHIAETQEEFKEAIKQLFKENFTGKEIEKRDQLLKKEYNNNANAELLMQWIH
jgi:hypothetical protein